MPRLKLRSKATNVAAFMVIAGFVVALGHYFYVTMYSGSQVGKVELSPGSQPGRFSSVEFDLDPSMNPVGFVWSGRTETEGSIDPTGVTYRALLYLGNRQVMGREFSLQHQKDDDSIAWEWKPLGASIVPLAGRYRLMVDEIAKHKMVISGMQIEIRRNVAIVNVAILAAAIAVTITGIALLVLIPKWPKVRAYFGHGKEGAHAAGNPVTASLSATRLAAANQAKEERVMKILVIFFVLMMAALFLAKWGDYI